MVISQGKPSIDAISHSDFDNEQWERVFAWKRVPTPGYVEETSWLEFVLRRKNAETGEWDYKKPYSLDEENDLLIDRMTAP
ncbi:hypothetical protein F9K91_10445 [Brucella tritici]|nr:hypothetical protein [Brucella tritici]KAB2665150.1 hypothetical protein F9K91_10445 [Brucella tritici]